MGLPSNTNALQNGFWQGYTVDRSLRFRASASAYLNRTFAAGNQQKWTWSGWVKRGALGAINYFLEGYPATAGNTNDRTQFYFTSNDTFEYSTITLGVVTEQVTTTQVFRDPSAWYHIIVALDTTQATASNRLKIYINGSQITTFSTATYPALNASPYINSAKAHYIGAAFNGSLVASTYFDGYQAEMNFVDGQQLTPSSFGAYDNNGVWEPIKYTGTYGTNGFYLPFSNTTSTTTLVADASGNGNNWTPNNISLTTGTGKYLGNISGSLDLSAGGSPSSMFKGSIASPAVYPATGATATFTPNSPISFSSSARVYVGIDLNGPSTGLVVNSTNFGAGGVANNSNGWVTVTSAGSPITTMSWTRASSGSLGMRVFAVEIDGVILIDNVIYGASYDSVTDSPTSVGSPSNYPVFNPLDKSSSITTSSGNLAASLAVAGWVSIKGSFGMSSGQWYWEALYSSGANMFAGIGTSATVLSSYPGSTSDSYGVQASNGNKYNNATATAYTSVIAATDVVGMAFDATAGTLTYYKNGASLGTAFTGIPSNTYFPMFGCDNNTIQINFGQQPFYYTPPTGFKALNAYNLPASLVQNGSQYMAATTYTGTGADATITNGGNNTISRTFQPDLVWIKSRSATTNHNLFNSVSGATKYLNANTTSAEATNGVTLTSFNANGFGLGPDSTPVGVNVNAATYVAWQWQAGAGTTSTNTSGSITSTVSVSAQSGFSIVSYTGTGAAATIGHGLGIAPQMIFVKKTSATDNWGVYHVSDPSPAASYALTLNSTANAGLNTTYWNAVAPTSSVFSVGTATQTNTSGATHIAYCFAPVNGYSSFGSYAGNGSATDGPFVYTGFRPRFILVKRSVGGIASWAAFDTSRSAFNLSQSPIYPNLTNAEATVSFGDILSNGFKLRATAGEMNGASSTYVYAAFAENPFSIARAR